MSYNQFATNFFLQLVEMATVPRNKGFVEVRIEGPTGHLEDAALNTFIREDLAELHSRHNDGRIRVKITGKGYRLAESIKVRSQSPPPSNPVGFAGSKS